MEQQPLNTFCSISILVQYLKDNLISADNCAQYLRALTLEYMIVPSNMFQM
jgi:hypothetical protein